MCSIDIPSIFVGRRSELVEIQLDKLTDRLLPANVDKKEARVHRSLCLNNDGYDGSDTSANYCDREKKNVSPSMKKCSHVFHALTDYCSICALNDELALSSINRLLESSDNPSQIMVMNDTATLFGTSMNSLIVGYLRDEVPSCSILNVFMKPLMNYHGIESYYALLNTATALDLSDCVIYRGCERTNMDEGRAVDSDVELSYRIACDLWPSLAPKQLGKDTMGSLQYQLWPFNATSSASKVFDIRSSLYFNIKQLSKLKRTGGSASTATGLAFHSLRSLSGNIRALHQSYAESYPDHWLTASHSRLAPQKAIHAVSYADILFPASSISGLGAPRSTIFSPARAYSDHELAVLLHWATPGITWPYNNNHRDEKSTPHQHSQSVDISTASTSCSALINRMPINAANTSSYMIESEQSSLMGRKSDQRSTSGHGGLHCTANLVFQSPYGRCDAAFLVDSAQQLLRAGAYKHLFGPAGSCFSSQEMTDAVEYVKAAMMSDT